MGIEYQPLTASVRELNRMLIDQQQWAGEMKLREADRGLKNMLAMSQLESAQQQQELTAFKLAEQERLHTPKIIQLSRIVQGGPDQLAEIEANPEAMANLTKVLDDEGVGLTYSPADKTWRHPISNEPVRFSPYEMKFRAPGMFGIIDGYSDNVASAKRTQGQLAEQIEALDKDIAKARKGQYSKQAVQDLTRQRQGLSEQFKEATRFLTPEGLLNYYENKQKQMLKRGAFYHNLGATDLANQMQRNADQAAESKRLVLKDMLAGKKEQGGKATGDITVYATEDQEYKGRKYKKGESRKIRYAPGQTELVVPQGWDFSDPLATKKRTGKGPKASFTYLQAIKKYADDLKDTSMFGSMTAPQKRLVRDAMDLAHKNVANQHEISADADNSNVYATIKAHFAEAHDRYWAMKESLQGDAWKDQPDEDGKTMLQYAIEMNPKIALMDEQQQKEAIVKLTENVFHATIDQVTAGSHRRYLPSPTTRAQEKQ